MQNEFYHRITQSNDSNSNNNNKDINSENNKDVNSNANVKKEEKNSDITNNSSNSDTLESFEFDLNKPAIARNVNTKNEKGWILRLLDISMRFMCEIKYKSLQRTQIVEKEKQKGNLKKVQLASNENKEENDETITENEHSARDQ